LDGLRLAGILEIPTLRPWEAHRPASFSYFGVALVAALLLFPPIIAVATILVCAWVDPLIGELRRRPLSVRARTVLAVLAAVVLWEAVLAIGTGVARPGIWLAGIVGATVAVAVESPQIPWIDDDLVMTLAPGAAVWAIALLFPGTFGAVAGAFT
jgi:dolichol kinase